MTLQIGRFTPFDPYAAAAHAARKVPADSAGAQHLQAQRPAGGQAGDAILGDIPPAPTPEARDLVAKAAEVAQQLHENNRELHFTTDDSTNRVIIQVRDLDGNVIKTIPPSKALDLLSGDAPL